MKSIFRMLKVKIHKLSDMSNKEILLSLRKVPMLGSFKVS